MCWSQPLHDNHCMAIDDYARHTRGFAVHLSTTGVTAGYVNYVKYSFSLIRLLLYYSVACISQKL